MIRESVEDSAVAKERDSHHSGPGSQLTFLKSAGLGHALSAGSSGNKFWRTFEISITLSEAGLAK